MDALEHLDLTDNDMDDLYEWFAAEGIDISEDDDICLLYTSRCV